ncbi:hypothetical protein BGS_0761 [Beggiatoa sp. SS]|nr:hypothetical protein BGS_0761 [Beggiatoa sp. SS]
MKKQPKLLQKNKLLRSAIITLGGLAILVTLMYRIAPFFEEIQSLGLSLELTPTLLFHPPFFPFPYINRPALSPIAHLFSVPCASANQHPYP